MLNEMKSFYVVKTFLILLLLVPSLIAQDFKTTNVKGNVKYRSGTSEVWLEVGEGTVLRSDDFVITGSKSSIQIKGSENIINLAEKLI